MTTIMLILLAAAAGFALVTWQRLSFAPVLLVMGIAMNTLGLLEQGPLLQITLQLGLTFLVFASGAELDITRVGVHFRTAVRVGLTQFFVLGAIGVGATLVLGHDPLTSLYVGLALPASSTLLVVTLLQQRQQLFEPFGRLVVGALFVQDVLVVLLLPVLTHLADGVQATGLAVAATLGLVALMWITMRWVAPRLLLHMGLDEEIMLLAVLAILFAFMGLAYAFDLPVVIGAFLAGVAMSGFPVGGVVRGQLTSLSDFFLAVFFVALGASVSVLEPRQWMFEGMLLTSILLVSPPLVTFIARRAGLTMRSSIEAAHLLAQCGELGLVVILLGVDGGDVPESVLAAMVMLVAVTTSLASFLSTDQATWWFMHRLPGRQRGHVDVPRPTGHVLLLGCGLHTRSVLDRLLAQGQSVVVVDDDAAVVEQLIARGVEAVRGDGGDYQLLDRVGARQARVIVSTMRRPHDYERLLKFVSSPQVLVRVLTPEAGERIESLGGKAVVESAAAAEEFLRLIDQSAILAKGAAPAAS